MVDINILNTEKIYTAIAFTIELEKGTSERYAEVAFDEYMDDVVNAATSFYLNVLPGKLNYEDGYYVFDVMVSYTMPNLEGKSITDAGVIESVKEYNEAIARDYANLLELTRGFVESHRGVIVKHIVNLPDIARDDI